MAEQSQYQVGNLVQLLSGGPTMTILHLNYANDAHQCAYFNKDDEYKTALIPPAALKAVSSDTGRWSV